MRHLTNKKILAICVLILLLVSISLLLVVVKQQQQLQSSASSDSRQSGIGNAVSEEVSPMVRISLPQENQTVTNPVTIAAEVEGNQTITNVSLFVDNDKTPVTEVTMAPYQTSITLTPGRHKVHVYAYDSNQNVKRSQEVVFMVE